MISGIANRIDQLDWTAISQSLWQHGFALTPPVLSADECRELVEMFPSEKLFRSHIVMARYRFGRGEYKYFSYPLPSIVQELRESVYPHVAPIANEWAEALGAKERFPINHEEFLRQCKKAGQTRPTPLLLHYEAGDFNCLHQDLYGAIAFPLQATCFLSRPGEDFTGGQFVLVEQQPRAQSKPEVIVANQGQMVIFTTRYRPVKGSRGYYRTNLKHGVSEVRSGTRYTLGVIFHDAE